MFIYCITADPGTIFTNTIYLTNKTMFILIQLITDNTNYSNDY